MADFILENYDWWKALHVIAVMSWMAAMLYLPRLFIYHCDAEPGSKQSETFKVMERKLSMIIMTPAMTASLVFGFMMMWANPSLFSNGWFHVKLLGILVMFGMHGMMARWRKNFVQDNNQKPQKYYRMMNEVPTIAMIIIVIMAVAEPF